MYRLIGLVLTPAHCTNLKNFHVTLVRLVCIIEILAIGSPYFEFWPLIGGRGKQWKHGRFFPKNRRYFSNFLKKLSIFLWFSTMMHNPKETSSILSAISIYHRYIDDFCWFSFIFPMIELLMEIFASGITDIQYFGKMLTIFPDILNLGHDH